MKLGARQIADFMKAPAQVAGTLVYGPDEGLVRERVKQLTVAILGEKFDPFALIELDEASLKENPTKLFEEASAMGFLVDKRVIHLRSVSEKTAQDVEAVIGTLDASTYIIVSDGELTPRSPMRQLFEQHQRLAALACYKDEAQNISQLIRSELAKAGMTIRSDALMAMASRLGNDRGVTQSEIDKMVLYKGGKGEVMLADVDALIPDNQENEAQEAAYALLSGDAGAFDKKLAALMRDGVQPIAILRSLQRHIQRLHLVRSQMQEGSGAEEAMKALRPPVFFKEEARFKGQLQALPQNSLARLLSRVADIEGSIKTGRASPELAMAELTQLSAKMPRR